MFRKLFPQRSLQTRITLATLAIFLIGIWSLTYFTSHALRKDMEHVMGDQQLSTVALIAAEADHELADRLEALNKIAASSAQAMLAGPAAMQASLEQRVIPASLFNGGIIVCDMDGNAVADFPVTTGRRGVNYREIDVIAAALREGRSTIGEPVIGKKLGVPVFSMAAPVRDAQGKMIGAVAGIINLAIPGFFDQITGSSYGKTGAYVLASPRSRLIVAASDKSRVMQPLPPAGVNPLIDRFMQGEEGSTVGISPLGVEMLASAKTIPSAGWSLALVLPTEEAFYPIREMQQRMLYATIVLTLLAGGLIWWLLQHQLRPIRIATDRLARMSGYYPSMQALPLFRQDEVGSLIGAFNALLQTLKQHDAALQASESRFRALTHMSSDFYWETDTEHRFIQHTYNTTVHADLALQKPHFIGLHPWDTPFVSPDEAGWQAHRALLDAHLPFRKFEIARCQTDYTVCYLSVSGDPVFNAAGEFTGYRGVGTDITERNNISIRLKEALIKAEAAALAKNEFIAHMSHEIRTPVNAIVGAARLLEYSLLTPSQRGYTEVMKHSSGLLLALVNDILDLSKIEAGHLELAADPFDLNRIVEGLSGIAAVSDKNKDIHFAFDLPPDLPPLLIGDAYRLEQVLNNLFSNAIKFTARGEIALRIQQHASDAASVTLRFSLTDTGIGIFPEKLIEIFSPFVQGESTTTRIYGGSGLGLTICRKLIKLMGSRIEVESAPGQGSCFSFAVRFLLPSTAGAGPNNPETAGRTLPPSLSSLSPLAGRRILMIEDNQFNRQVLEGMLKHLDIEVDAAIDGHDGIECFKVGSPYDAILMDLHMPGLDGFDCARGIRALPEGGQVPILALTANVLATTAEACRAAGMNAHLSKPVEPETLYRTLAHWILGATTVTPSVVSPILTDPADHLPDDLPGLDSTMASAWSNGSARALAGLLDRMLIHTLDNPTQLARHIAAGELKEAALLTHDLMGVAATVGASTLVAAAQRLNAEIRAGCPNSALARVEIKNITTEFLHLNVARERLQSRLARLLPASEAAPPPG